VTTADTETIAGVVALVGIGVCTASLLVLHLAPTGLSWLHDPVSQYGITPYRLGYRIQTIAMGISAIGVAVGVGQLAIRGCTQVTVLLVLFGVARLVIGWFPMDSPGTPPSQTGRRHGALALVAFATATLGALRLGGILGNAHQWGGSSTVILVLGFLMLATLLGMGTMRRTRPNRQCFGLVERGFYLGAIAFLTVAGVELMNAR
jgi:hypothetical protein